MTRKTTKTRTTKIPPYVAAAIGATYDTLSPAARRKAARAIAALTPNGALVAAAPRVSTIDVLGSLFYGPETDRTMSLLLPLADAELPEIVASHCDLAVMAAAARRMVGASRDGAKVVRAIDRLQRTVAGTDTEDALLEIQWRTAEAGFAAGVLIGLRLAGGVR
jgi:hypothetical protein